MRNGYAAAVCVIRAVLSLLVSDGSQRLAPTDRRITTTVRRESLLLKYRHKSPLCLCALILFSHWKYAAYECVLMVA